MTRWVGFFVWVVLLMGAPITWALDTEKPDVVTTITLTTGDVFEGRLLSQAATDQEVGETETASSRGRSRQR